MAAFLSTNFIYFKNKITSAPIPQKKEAAPAAPPLTIPKTLKQQIAAYIRRFFLVHDFEIV